jgi:hypothetical protein
LLLLEAGRPLHSPSVFDAEVVVKVLVGVNQAPGLAKRQAIKLGVVGIHDVILEIKVSTACFAPLSPVFGERVVIGHGLPKAPDVAFGHLKRTFILHYFLIYVHSKLTSYLIEARAVCVKMAAGAAVITSVRVANADFEDVLLLMLGKTGIQLVFPDAAVFA